MTTYIPGDYWVYCDVCGFKTRSSMTRKRWDNALVCLADWEPQHSQDFVRGYADKQTVPDPRPEPTMQIVGPLTTTATASATPGATTINVELTTRFEANDNIGIMLSNGSVHRAQIQTIINLTIFTLTSSTKLPDSMDSGALIVNYDAVAEGSIE